MTQAGMNVRRVLQSQYLAALAMLREAIVKCPQSAWDSPRDKDRTWFRAYHAVYFAHKYLQPTSRDFRRWRGHGQTHGGMPIPRGDLLEYLRFVEQQVPEKLRLADFEAEAGFSAYRVNSLEMHLINIRHIQQHAGELYERLGARAQPRLRWAGTMHRKTK